MSQLVPSDSERTRERRVREILGYMVKGLWSPRRCLAMTKKWDVSLTALEDYQREARGMLRMTTSSNRDEVRTELIASISHIREQASKAKTPAMLQVALKSAELIGKLVGAFAPDEVNVTVQPMNRETAITELRELTLTQAKQDPQLLDALLADLQALKHTQERERGQDLPFALLPAHECASPESPSNGLEPRDET